MYAPGNGACTHDRTQMRPLARALLVLALLHATSAWAEPPSTAIWSKATFGQGMRGLTQLLREGKLSRWMTLKMVANRNARPYLALTLRALPYVQGLPGMSDVLKRLANGRSDGDVRGAAFEVVADACLRDRIQAVGTKIGNKEVDAVLKDGTVVEMKDRHGDFIAKVKEQLSLRCQGTVGAMLVVPTELNAAQLASLRQRGEELGRRFTVVVTDPSTLTAREVLRVGAP
jgi:hypothetical protein